MKKLLWVLAFSVALHLALLFGPHLSLPLSMAPAPDLQIKLEIPPPSVVKQREAAKPVRLRPPQPKPRRLPAKEVSPPIAPDNSVAESAPQPAPPPVAESVPEDEKAPPMPQNATIKFAVFKGVNGMRVGRAEQTWKLDGEHFTISSVAEATGLFSLFASGKHVQVSQGEITPAGLKPASYRVERGQGEDKVDAARFDWSAMTLALASGSDRKTVKLPEGTQDLLSFMYQLAFAPPQRSAVQLSITNGRKLDNYTYWVVEEALETPMGTLQTLHLGKRREEGEKNTEVWLAADYHYLPVKISQVDKDGDGLVLLVNEIELTQ